jgi:hypothetical protein
MLMKALNIGINSEVDFGKFLLDNHSNRDLLRILVPDIDLTSVSERSITLKEVSDYLESKQDTVSFQVDPNTVEYFMGAQRDITIQIGQVTTSIEVGGDIALIPIENDEHIGSQDIQIFEFNWIYQSFATVGNNGKVNVSKRGATTGITSGYLSRPTHFMFPMGDENLFKKEFCGDTVANMTLKNQLLIRSDSTIRFGSGGDSGSLVYIQENDEVFAVAIFVGGDPRRNYYVATPIEFLTKFGYSFVSV